MMCKHNQRPPAHGARRKTVLMYSTQMLSAFVCTDSAFESAPNTTRRPDPFAELNPAQRLAVQHGTEAEPDLRPLLVIAGAGSGKTNTLAHRVAKLILHG